VAQDERVMPGLVALGARGASFQVEPCRDRLTYLCLQAALIGHDESSLLTLHRNFQHDQRGSDSLLDRAAARGRVVGAGAHDLGDYREAFAALALAPSPEAPERESLDRIAEFGPADLTFVGFSRGDRVAHSHGEGGPEYAAAFGEIDRSIRELRARIPPDASLVVFGDHGHDAAGRHLPGGPATTFAVYEGPAFREGFRGALAITDHRVLLGLLLGLRTPAVYTGPPLGEIFREGWLEGRYGAAPELRGSPVPSASPASRVVLVGLLALALAGLAALLPRARGAGAALALIVMLSGYGYPAIRRVIHDHGDSPWRWGYLLVPLGAGFVAARLVRPAGERRLWGAAGSLLVVFFCLFATANYYGSARAIVLAALVALVVVAAEAWGAGVRRPAVYASLAIGLAVLGLFYDVTRVGGELPGQGYYELKCSLVREGSRGLLIAGKLLLATLLAQGVRADRADRLAAALTVGLSLGAALLGVEVGRGLVVAVVLWRLVALVAGRGLWPRTSLALGLAILPHFFARPAPWVPIEALVGGSLVLLRAFPAALVGSRARTTAATLTVLTAAYLLLWPLVGFRLAGLDFSFMFRWVPASRYEDLWWAIALGTGLKLAWPYLLLGDAARLAGGVDFGWLRLAFAAKALCLALFAAAHALAHPLTSHLAQEVICELFLLLFVLLLQPLMEARSLALGLRLVQLAR
jgi:hypothetical protein